MELDVLVEAMDQLVGSDPASCSDGESLLTLQVQLARLDAFSTSATGVFDASGSWALEGARSAAAWIVTRCRLPKSHARRLVHRSRVLVHLPGCARAWSEGAITAAHVDCIAARRSRSTAEALDRDEGLLVGHARTLGFESFSKAVDYWAQLADPDGAEDHEERRHQRRDVYLSNSLDGMWMGRMLLDPIGGTIVATELARLERALFEGEWAAARVALGREPTVSELSRTPGQRRADALVEMATRSQTAGEAGRRPVPLFSVLVDYETFSGRVCELANGTVVAPGSLLRWLDQADIERAVFGPSARVEVGATARLFTGATRRAIELRDRGCVHPYCDATNRDLQVDHIVPFVLGGPTTQANGRLLCGFHNRLRNQAQAGPGQAGAGQAGPAQGQAAPGQGHERPPPDG